MRNKFFSKAVFYDERNSIIIPGFTYIIVYTFVIIYFLRTLKYLVTVPGVTYSTVSLLTDVPNFFFFFVCIAIILYSYRNKEIKYSFYLTQPIKKDSIIITRTFSFLLSFTVPTIIYGIVSSILININRDLFGANTGYLIETLLMKLGAILLALTLITILVQLMEMLFGRNTSSFLMPLLLGFTLMMNLDMLPQLITTKIPVIKDFFTLIRDFFMANSSDPYIQTGSLRIQSLLMIISNYFRNPSLLLTSIVLILSVLLFYICILLNRKIKVENISANFMFNFSKIIFKLILSTFIVTILFYLLGGLILFSYWLVTKSALTTNLISLYGLAGKENIEQTIYLIIDLAFIPSTILVYKFLSKLMKKREVA